MKKFTDPNLPETFRHIAAAIEALRAGRGILLTDDADRENEGDLIFPADGITSRQMAQMIRSCSGIVCLCLPADKARQLHLRPMVRHNTSRFGTRFTVSIEAVEGVTTGVSAADRVTTIRRAIAEDTHPDELARPGHVFPLIAHRRGVFGRRGHTEGSVDLMRIAGLPPYAVLCELTNPDGSMARRPEIEKFSRRHNYPIVTIEEIARYRQAASSGVPAISAPPAGPQLPTK